MIPLGTKQTKATFELSGLKTFHALLMVCVVFVGLNIRQSLTIDTSLTVELFQPEKTTVKQNKPPPPFEIDLLSCNNGTTTELGFLHIPKTGGSSIESESKRSGKKWGYFAWQKKKKSQDGLHETYLKDKYLGNITEAILWHVPLSILSTMIKENPPYYDQDLFAVIRNPFARMVSEVFFLCSFRRTKICLNKRKVNDQLRSILTEQLDCVRNRGMPNMDGEIDIDILKCFLRHGSHFLPQWFFFYNPFSGKRDTRYLVHFENLAGDFHDLMDVYSMNIRLNNDRKARKSNYSQFAASDLFRGFQDFDNTTRNLILELYDMDFDLGGYSRDENYMTSFSFPSQWVVPSPSSLISANGTRFWELPCYIQLPRMNLEE